jgi:hypothetical protein
MSSSVELVLAAERDLLRPAVRSSAAELNRLLDADFSEIGASGRVWTRADVIASLLDEPGAGDLVVSDMAARHVTEDVILVTDTTRSPALTAHRASWWRRDGAAWRCYFHQGTPTPNTAR